jgi:hypothetical protein
MIIKKIIAFLLIIGCAGFQAAAAKKLYVDVYGGLSLCSPGDMNRFAQADNALQNFQYDNYLDYLQNLHEINSWSKTSSGQRGELKLALPAGVRLRWQLTHLLALSLAMGYQRTIRTTTADFSYQRNIDNSSSPHDRLLVEAYTLNASNFIPQLGLHLVLIENNVWQMQAFAAAGPLFANCRHENRWTYEWFDGQASIAAFNQKTVLLMNGRGTGYSLDFGGRLEMALSAKLEVFLEAVYALQKVAKINGDGSETINNQTTNWAGSWKIQEEKLVAPWGEATMERPGIQLPATGNTRDLRDFQLNFSGFSLRAGISLRI